MSEILGLSQAALWSLAAFGLGCATALAVASLAHIALRSRRRDLRHLGQATRDEPFFALMAPALERVAYLAAHVSRPSYKAWAKAQLQRADLTAAYTPELMETLKLASLLAMAILYPPVMFAFFGTMLWSPYLGLLAGVYFVPDLMLSMAASARINHMRRALPFVIDLVAVSAEAGMAFQPAVANVIENSRGAAEALAAAPKGAGTAEGPDKSAMILAEFGRMLDAMKMGRTLQQAVTDTVERVDFPEFRTFASAIIQADHLGTPISDTLKRQSAELQARIGSLMEEKANQAPIKILFPLILFIFPVTGWVIVGPILIQALYGGV